MNLPFPDGLPEVPDLAPPAAEPSRVHQLQKELKECKEAREKDKATAEVARAETTGAHSRLGDDYLELCQRHGRTMTALSRSNGCNVQLVRALRALVDSLKGITITFPTDAQATAHGRAWREAEEVLALVEVPFG